MIEKFGAVVYDRQALLTALFRETDRMQRMKYPMSIVLFGIEGLNDWRAHLGERACEAMLSEVATRTEALLRSYDLLGRPNAEQFFVGLPACDTARAMELAMRVRTEVFGSPFKVSGEPVFLAACFGVAASHGRSPVVVLVEAEKALQRALAAGPETIQCVDSLMSQPLSPFVSLSVSLASGSNEGDDQITPRG
jgi:diguanylate cyclase (GGDEF)-like protein